MKSRIEKMLEEFGCSSVRELVYDMEVYKDSVERRRFLVKHYGFDGSLKTVKSFDSWSELKKLVDLKSSRYVEIIDADESKSVSIKNWGENFPGWSRLATVLQEATPNEY
jgi:hypothetical protein